MPLILAIPRFTSLLQHCPLWCCLLLIYNIFSLISKYLVYSICIAEIYKPHGPSEITAFLPHHHPTTLLLQGLPLHRQLAAIIPRQEQAKPL